MCPYCVCIRLHNDFLLVDNYFTITFILSYFWATSFTEELTGKLIYNQYGYNHHGGISVWVFCQSSALVLSCAIPKSRNLCVLFLVGLQARYNSI